MTQLIAKRNAVEAKHENAICNALDNLTIGRTQVINGKVVTRWAAEIFEVGTWGRETVTYNEAVDQLL